MAQLEIKISNQDIESMVTKFKSFYDDIESITDYYIKKKHERLQETRFTNVNHLMFDDFTMSPMDMSFDLVEITGEEFNKLVTPIATFPIESQIGRRVIMGIKETNTNKYVGFLRCASPVMSIKPRSDFFGENIRLEKVNQFIYNGQTIVPVQPFGFNYLGGKLMVLACLSNEVRELYNSKYGTNILSFETTSLYGNSKSNSQYDGLEPYLKYRGLTESKNLLFPTDDVYQEIRNVCKLHYSKPEWNGGIVNPTPPSPKMREFSKVLSIMKSHLKIYNPNELDILNTYLKNKCESKEQKRFYQSDFGFKNIREHILNGDKLIEGEREKYDFKNLVSYWTNKSTKRYNNIKLDGRLKTEIETYSIDGINNGIDFKIIR